MFDANTTIHTEPQFVLHKTSTKLRYMRVRLFVSSSFTVLKRNITYRYTVVHKKSSASFLFFFLHVSKRQDRHFIVSQNAPTSEPCFTVSLIFPYSPPPPFARHVKDSYVGLTAKNTRDADKRCPRRDVLID